MPIPIRTQLFNAFLGTQEGLHSIPLPALYSPDGSQNLYMDKYGRAAQIPGYSAQNSALTTDTGGSATGCNGLIPYRQVDGTREVLGIFDDDTDEWEIHVSTDQGANWTFKSQPAGSNVNTLPDASQFGDDLFIVNGVMAPQIYDGSTVAAVGETQSPTVSSSGTSTGLLAGTFKWKLVSVEADGLRHGGSVASTALQLSAEQASLTWTADADTDVVGYELYRTTGTGVVYYFVDYIDVRTTAAYTDAISDLEILENRVLQEHGDAPPSGTWWVESHKQRMWWGRTDANPQRVHFSDPGNPDSVGADNFLNFQDAETVGDTITGLEGNFEGFLVVFQEQSVWTVSGTGLIIGNIQDWTVRRTNAQIGAVCARAVVRVPAGAKYADQLGEAQTTNVVTLAYWTPAGDIRIFDGENDIVISNPVKDTIKTFSYANRAKIHAYNDVVNGQVVWFFPASGSSECDTAVVWNYRWGVWYKWTPMSMACSAVIDTSSTSQQVLVGEALKATGGFVYDFFTGNDFNGSNIDSRWMSKTIYGHDEQGLALATLERWRWVDFQFADQDSVTATIEWFAGDDAPGATAHGSTTASTQAAANKNHIQHHVILHASDGRYLHSEGLRVRVSAAATAGPWTLEGMMVGYQHLPFTKRRNAV